MKVCIFEDDADDFERIRNVVQAGLKAEDISLVGDIPNAKKLIDNKKLTDRDVFFVDLYFHGQANGLMLIEMLRGQYPFTPVFVLSNTIDNNDAQSAYARGATAFEFKRVVFAEDYDPESLAAQVARADATVNQLTLIHASDLHASATLDAETVANVFTRDARRVLEKLGAKPDFLILSGDIANRGQRAEYEVAQRIIDNIVRDLHIDRTNVVLVPGNHDVDWHSIWYDWHSKGTISDDLKAASEEYCGGYITKIDGAYSKRFDNYALFSRYYGAPLFADREQDHGWCLTNSDHLVQFYCLNSAGGIDEFHPKRIRIPPEAVTSCLDQSLAAADADALKGREDHLIRIVVMHHPPTGEEAPESQQFLGRLVDEGARFLLHGHVHALNRESVFGATQGRKFNVIGSGSLGASKDHRPEGVPVMYHIIQIYRRQRNALVHTRAQYREQGRFEPYQIWATEGDPLGNKAYYECDY